MNGGDKNAGNKAPEPAAAAADGKASTKKKAVTESVERIESELVDAKLDGELGGEKEAEDSASKEDGGEKGEEKQESKRGPKIGDDVQVKICDMGNGCWTYHHFTPEIQTRQYRSPEVIIGADYNTSADVWSFACTIFEMVTGDFLFEPRKGNNYDKDDDHLAQMMELLGRMPKNLAMSGKHSKKYFDSRGNLRRIKDLRYWPVKKVLTDKYLIREEEAQAFSDFLLPMLEWHHDRRATAQQMLDHPWLNMPDNYDYKLTKKEWEKIQFKKDMLKDQDPFAEDSKMEMGELIDSDPEMNEADHEQRPRTKRYLAGNHDLSGQDDLLPNSPWDVLYDSDSDRSLEDPEEQ